MIIDCHGHYTTVPAIHQDYRNGQIKQLEDPKAVLKRADYQISDDDIRETLENSQLKFQRERGTDLTIFSPRASAMAHHLGNRTANQYWAEACNTMIARVVGLYPENFVGVCQLPQYAGGDTKELVPELERCITELGMIGCNLNPDPSGGWYNSPPMHDRHWYPVYEKMVELDIPAMIHVSASCNPAFHATGGHYIAADTTVFMQLLLSDLFKDFPTLRLIIPHGGGAVPYHWGRYKGIAEDQKRPPLEETMLQNVYFDTCVYHLPGIELLTEVVPVKNILFASEMVGAVRGINPDTGFYYDDTKRYIDQASALSDSDRKAIYEDNIRKVFPRLKA